MAMNHPFEPRVQHILARIAAACGDLFTSALTGVYVHGSLAFGCFLWEKSDIDFLVVTREEPTDAQKERLIALLLALDTDSPPKGLEMSLVLARNCRASVYPTPFSLHFSNMHKQACKDDLRGYCARMHGTDKDLAAHFAVVRQAGVKLCGEAIEDVFADVPRTTYLDSIRYDIQSAASDITHDPVYYTLNLCRALAYAQDGLVLSEAGGAEWALTRTPNKYSAIIENARMCYHGEEISYSAWDLEALISFAQYMLARML